MTNCPVLQNCRHRYECSWCNNFSDYQPENRKIKSPAQIESHEKRKAERKEKKKSAVSRGGRRNRQMGYRAEADMKKQWEQWSIPCEKVPMSGALKTKITINDTTLELKSDLRVTIRGTSLYNEVKRRANINGLYKLTERDDCAVHIENFCYIMTGDIFHRLLNGLLPDVAEVEDKGFKALHGFFEQDHADIVSLRSSRKHWLIAVTEKTWEMIKEA